MIPESLPRNSFLASSGSSGSNRMAVSYLFGVILRSCLLSADRAPGRFAGSKEYVPRRGFRGGLRPFGASRDFAFQRVMALSKPSLAMSPTASPAAAIAASNGPRRSGAGGVRTEAGEPLPEGGRP